MRRDESTRDAVSTSQVREREQESAARRRWLGIVAAIRTFTGRYNQGAGREVLTVIDDSDGESRLLGVTVTAPGQQTLRMVVTGTELCVRPTPSPVGAADDGQRWMTFAATDEAIAAYALQDWLAHLQLLV